MEEHYPQAKKVLLVVDRLEFHYTPNHGSWLNMAEIELSHLSRQCLDQRLKDMAEVQKEVSFWLERRNKEGHVVDWRFTINETL